jgi:tetratricopeptide (TPR) repeat protein
VRYREEMRARHWSRTAFAMAVLFGGMAAACRLLLGAWPFEGAEELAWLCVAAGIYFHILGRRRLRTLPDPSILLQKAFELASTGRIDPAIALLSNAIRQNPHLWQALQYRGELYLAQQNFTAAARDFSAALRIAPEEHHLSELLAASNSGTMPASHDSEAR